MRRREKHVDRTGNELRTEPRGEAEAEAADHDRAEQEPYLVHLYSDADDDESWE